MTATITFKSTPTGEIEVITTYTGGWDKDDPAHQAAAHVLHKMSDMYQPIGLPRHIDQAEAAARLAG